MLVILCHVYKWYIFFWCVCITTCSQPYLRNVCNNLHVLSLVFLLHLNSLPEGNYYDATSLLLQQEIYIDYVIALQENIGHVTLLFEDVTLTYTCIVFKGCVKFLVLVLVNHDTCIASNDNISLCFICPISVISAKGLFCLDPFR